MSTVKRCASSTWRDWSCTVRVVVNDEDPAGIDAARAAVLSTMKEVSDSVNRFDPDSDISMLNRTPGHLLPVSALTIELLRTAVDVAKTTDGAVVPTLGRQLRSAGYLVDIDVVRSRLAIANSSASVATPAGAIDIDDRLGCVRVPAGTELDLGASAKAWTVDTAARRAAQAAGCAVVVSIGGDLACAPAPATAAGNCAAPSWSIDVCELEDEAAATTVRLDHGALATSSTIARRWKAIDSGDAALRWANHLIDPGTGQCVDGPWRTCTVWAPTAISANALSTAALVWGAEAVDRLTAHGATALLFDREGHAHAVGQWPAGEVAA